MADQELYLHKFIYDHILEDLHEEASVELINGLAVVLTERLIKIIKEQLTTQGVITELDCNMIMLKLIPVPYFAVVHSIHDEDPGNFAGKLFGLIQSYCMSTKLINSRNLITTSTGAGPCQTFIIENDTATRLREKYIDLYSPFIDLEASIRTVKYNMRQA